MSKKKVPDEILIKSYERLGNIWEVAKEVGLCGQSVHERLIKLGIQKKMNYFTDDDKFFLLEHYKDYLLRGELDILAKKMGRTKNFICRQAKKYGFTDLARPKSVYENYTPPKGIDWKSHPNGHPKGMKGKKHSDATKDKISATSKEMQKEIEESGRRPEIIKKMIETKHERGNLINPRVKQTWKAGWREIGGKRKYFRSRWEANYARYLQLLKEQGHIHDWEHEAKVFWFDGIKRGCVSFLPDFEVTLTNLSQEYHEVKGWMDDRSKTKIRRMGIYYPDVILRVIDSKWFKSNNRTLTQIIKDWET